MNKAKLGLLFDSMCAANNQIIMTGQVVQPVCLFLTQEVMDNKVPAKIVALNLDKKHKQQAIQHIKDAALKKEGVIGYILIYDAIATYTDKELHTTSKGDCCMRTIYTPKEKIVNMQWHQKGKLGKNEIVIGRGLQFDLWDSWNECAAEDLVEGK